MSDSGEAVTPPQSPPVAPASPEQRASNTPPAAPASPFSPLRNHSAGPQSPTHQAKSREMSTMSPFTDSAKQEVPDGSPARLSATGSRDARSSYSGGGRLSSSPLRSSLSSVLSTTGTLSTGGPVTHGRRPSAHMLRAGEFAASIGAPLPKIRDAWVVPSGSGGDVYADVHPLDLGRPATGDPSGPVGIIKRSPGKPGVVVLKWLPNRGGGGVQTPPRSAASGGRRASAASSAMSSGSGYPSDDIGPVLESDAPSAADLASQLKAKCDRAASAKGYNATQMAAAINETYSEDDFSGPLDQVLREFTLEGPRPTVHQLDTLTEALGEQLPSVKLYATAFFIKHGFYYTGLKVALPDPALRRALLEALRPMVRSSDGEGDDGALRSWRWQSIDKASLVGALGETRAVLQYKRLRRIVQAAGTDATLELLEKALLLTITDQLLLLHAASSGKGAADPNPSLGLLSSTLRDMDAAGIHLQRNELRSALGHTPPGTRPASQRPPTTAPVITGSSAHGSGRPAGPAAAAFEEAAGAQVVWRSPDWDGAETPPPGQRRPSDAQLPADNAVDAAAASPPAHTVHTVTSASQEAAPAPEEAPAADAERAAEAEAAAEPAAAADDEAGAVANDAAAEAVPTAAEPAAAEEEAAAADEQQLAEPANAASEAAPADAPAPEASAAPPVAIEAVAEPATGAADAEPLAKAAAEPTAAAPAGADSNGTQRRRSDGDAASLQSSPSNDAHPHSMFAKGASSIDRAVRESSSSIQYVKGLQVDVDRMFDQIDEKIAAIAKVAATAHIATPSRRDIKARASVRVVGGQGADAAQALQTASPLMASLYLKEGRPIKSFRIAKGIDTPPTADLAKPRIRVALP